MVEQLVGALRVRYPRDVDVEQLTTLALRMERSLRFYADAQHWLDGQPLHTHPEDGLLSIMDNGAEARYALGLHDYPLGQAT